MENSNSDSVKEQDKKTDTKTEPEDSTGMKSANANNAPQNGDYHKSILELVKDSGNPEAEKIKNDIDAVREKRNVLIEQIKRARKRINYKLAEQDTIERFIQMNESAKDFQEKLRKVRTLTRQKHSLEFRISTESFSLSDEKNLIGKIKSIDSELSESLRVVRLFRKRDLIKKDLEGYAVQLNNLDTEIGELDKQLDDLYSQLRKILKMGEKKPVRPGQQRPKRKEDRPRMQEVNLEDIVVIKRKSKDKKAEIEE